MHAQYPEADVNFQRNSYSRFNGTWLIYAFVPQYSNTQSGSQI